MAFADRMAALFLKRLGPEPILGVNVDSKILHRGTAGFNGSPQIYSSAAATGVVTLVTPSHLFLIESGHLLFSTPWNRVISLTKLDHNHMVWILEIDLPTYGPGAIALQPRNVRETDLFMEFVSTMEHQLEIS